MKSTSKPSKENNSQVKGTQSVHRTIALIRALAKRNKPGARLTSLAKDVGLHITTAHRILSSLVEEGIVTLDSATKLYNLGFEVYLLGKNAQQFTLRYKLRPLMEEIAFETGDTVSLVIRSGYDLMCIDLVQGEHPIRATELEIGASLPLGAGAGSQALLAHVDKKEKELFLTYNALRYETQLGLTVESIEQDFKKTVQRGYGLCADQIHEGVSSVAVSLISNSGATLCAIMVSAIKSRMGKQRQREIVGIINRLWGGMVKEVSF